MASYVPTARKSAGLGAGTATAGFAGEGTNQNAEQPGLAREIGRGTGQGFSGVAGHRAHTVPMWPVFWGREMVALQRTGTGRSPVTPAPRVAWC